MYINRAHFQEKYGWNKKENQVQDPYPDHAVLSAEFELEEGDTNE